MAPLGPGASMMLSGRLIIKRTFRTSSSVMKPIRARWLRNKSNTSATLYVACVLTLLFFSLTCIRHLRPLPGLSSRLLRPTRKVNASRPYYRSPSHSSISPRHRSLNHLLIPIGPKHLLIRSLSRTRRNQCSRRTRLLQALRQRSLSWVPRQ